MSRSTDNSLFGMVLVIVNKVDRRSAGSIEIKQLNKAAEMLLAYAKEELIDQPLDLILASDAQSGLLKASVLGIKNSATDTFPCELVNKSGSHFPVTITPLPFSRSGKLRCSFYTKDHGNQAD